MTRVYNIEKLPEVDFKIDIEHLYPILEDENEEKKIDLQEVETQTMSRKAYIEKWRKNTDSELELQTLVDEQDMFDNLRGMGVKAELGV